MLSSGRSILRSLIMPSDAIKTHITRRILENSIRHGRKISRNPRRKLWIFQVVDISQVYDHKLVHAHDKVTRAFYLFRRFWASKCNILSMRSSLSESLTDCHTDFSPHLLPVVEGFIHQYILHVKMEHSDAQILDRFFAFNALVN